jgi:hypothetical protein
MFEAKMPWSELTAITCAMRGGSRRHRDRLGPMRTRPGRECTAESPRLGTPPRWNSAARDRQESRDANSAALLDREPGAARRTVMERLSRQH